MFLDTFSVCWRVAPWFRRRRRPSSRQSRWLVAHPGAHGDDGSWGGAIGRVDHHARHRARAALPERARGIVHHGDCSLGESEECRGYVQGPEALRNEIIASVPDRSAPHEQFRVGASPSRHRFIASPYTGALSLRPKPVTGTTTLSSAPISPRRTSSSSPAKAAADVGSA